MAIPREPVVEMQRRFGRPGTGVLDRLRQARAASGQLTPESIDAVAAELGLPRAHVYGAATFFEEIGLRRRGERHVQVCAGTACFAVSGGRHVPAVERQLGLSRGECLPDGSLSLQPVYCLGYCYGGPAALDDEQACVGPDLVDQLSGAAERRDPEIPAYSAVDRPVLLAGVLRGEQSWRVWPDVVRARDGAAVIAQVTASGLRGRGGAGFPAVAQVVRGRRGADAGPALPRRQRRRGRSGLLRRSAADGARPASRARGHGARGARRRAPPRASSTCARSTRAPATRMRAAVARGARRRPPRRGRARQRFRLRRRGRRGRRVLRRR